MRIVVDAAGEQSEPARQRDASRRVWRYRHTLPVRLTHWITAISLLILLMSGLQIFNAHPALYWGHLSDFDAPVFAIDPLTGTNTLFGTQWPNGLSNYETALPGWMTIPERRSLPEGRQWHFLFAWVLVGSLAAYWIWGLVSRHLWRDVLPGPKDVRAVPSSVAEHARLRFHNRPGRYNSLQKLAYGVVLVVILPAIILTGLTMSPAVNAGWPWLVELFGGRQSARTIHFICAMLLVLFTIVHVLMALVSGPFNAALGIVTGWKRERVEGDGR